MRHDLVFGFGDVDEYVAVTPSWSQPDADAVSAELRKPVWGVG
jgi:hypothetical protein